MTALILDSDTEQRLADLARTTGKTPAEIVGEALRLYQATRKPDDTAYLLSSPANAARLLKAVEDIRQGRHTPRGLLGDD